MIFRSEKRAVQNAECKVQKAECGAGVPTIQYPFYLNFGRETWGMSGERTRMQCKMQNAKCKRQNGEGAEGDE
jgi:hypothetical protein